MPDVHQNPAGAFRAPLFYNTPVVFILVTGLLLPGSLIVQTLALAIDADVRGISLGISREK